MTDDQLAAIVADALQQYQQQLVPAFEDAFRQGAEAGAKAAAEDAYLSGVQAGMRAWGAAQDASEQQQANQHKARLVAISDVVHMLDQRDPNWWRKFDTEPAVVIDLPALPEAG